MKGLEIYVKSSALGNTGIHWRNISKAGQPREEPEILGRKITPKEHGGMGTIEYLVNDTKPSFLIVLYENKIFLEVTGIEASQERSKRLGREVFDIIAWVADRNNDSEHMIRLLAVRTLLSLWKRDLEFLKTISSAVEFNGLDAFQVEVEKINKLSSTGQEILGQFLEEDKNQSLHDQSKIVWLDSRIINSDEEADFLANQIKQSPLPKDNLPLVVIADARKDRNLYFKTIVCGKPLIPNPREGDLNVQPNGSTPSEKKKVGSMNLGIFTAGILIGLLVGLLIAIVFLGAKLPPKTQPTSSPPQLLSPQNPPPQSIQPSVINKAQLNQNPPCLQIPPCVTTQMKNSGET